MLIFVLCVSGLFSVSGILLFEDSFAWRDPFLDILLLNMLLLSVVMIRHVVSISVGVVLLVVV
jgi:hypothetical protein